MPSRPSDNVSFLCVRGRVGRILYNVYVQCMPQRYQRF